MFPIENYTNIFCWKKREKCSILIFNISKNCVKSILYRILALKNALINISLYKILFNNQKQLIVSSLENSHFQSISQIIKKDVVYEISLKFNSEYIFYLFCVLYLLCWFSSLFFIVIVWNYFPTDVTCIYNHFNNNFIRNIFFTLLCNNPIFWK